MKKMMKIAAMLSLALSLVFTSTMPAEAAMNRMIMNGNCFTFEFEKARYNNTSVYVGQTVGAVLRNDINGNDVTWTSSNKKVATVDKYGNVTGKKAGKVTITATDGVHTAKMKMTVKALSKAKKNEVVLNYGNDVVFELGKTYTIKTLKGSAVKKVVKHKFNKVNGKKVTFTNGTTDHSIGTDVVLKNGKTVEFFSRVDHEAKYVQCEKIIKRDMAEAGITMNSTDLEKAMFIYNWAGMNIDHSVSAKCGGCRQRGSFCGILHGTGDCDVYAEAVDVIADVVGLWTVALRNKIGDHQFNGIRVDGEWYVMDTMQCEAWEFCSGNPNFLSSYNRIVDHSKAMAFTLDSDSLDDITFTSTKYDDKKWPEYYDLYVEVNQPETMNDDYWN